MEKNQYLDMFIEESREHLQAINDHLLHLETNPGQKEIIGEIFRSAHTLKGMAATMGYEEITNLTHQMENILDGIRNGTYEAGTTLIDIVFEAVDHIERMVEDIASGGTGKADVKDVLSKLFDLENNGVQSEVAAVMEKPRSEESTFDDFELTVLSQSMEQGYVPYTVKVILREDCILKAARVVMIFDVLEQIGEVIKSTPPVEELEEEAFDSQFTLTFLSKESADEVKAHIFKVSEVEAVSVDEVVIDKPEPVLDDGNEEVKETAKELPQEQDTKKQASANKTIRVNIDRLDALMNLFEELVIDKGRLEQISADLNNHELTDTVEHMSRISGDLQNIILTMRMVPVEQVFNRFPRMVRGLAKELNKHVHLEVSGAETELDRTVIDEIGDPLVHLLRNSIDHGVETPSERIKKGKPEQGTIHLKAYHSGNHVFIEVADDGAGIDRDKVLAKAVSKGAVPEKGKENLSDSEVYNLLFSSGLSTRDEISDISGRGVGLDVVKSKIESLGGNVTISSKKDEGTTFSVQLPLTLSIISVMLVEVEKEKYAIPLSSIIETAIIKKSDILRAHNQEVIDFRGRVVPLIDLKKIFNVPKEPGQADEHYSIVVVRKGDKMAALIVDTFIGQQEIVLKALGHYLNQVFAVSGATILGDGQVALIIDCNTIIR
ncbi:chemotaxis protein CheA [Alteribacter keqinensis]|uniref:Chemotaxis protein CheA n=1 Tax=Alteribacter keqinensis TaxID=2483800 RepID=A0A3M7TXR8_9BACI|nr:chemotaxis protein CheA [Alteribacter keqinensis]RNA69574.1 chemotaxis protein CheA [Alteribacter keqinensis]